MSDLTSTNCGCTSHYTNSCGCNTGMSSCSWIILLLLFCGNSGNGSFFGNNNCDGNNSCNILIWILLLSSCCGQNNGFFNFGGGCGCGRS